MFIDDDGSVNLTAFLLSPGRSVDIIARSIDAFFGDTLKNIVTFIDSRLQLRCILNFTPNKHEHQRLIRSLEEQGWYIRILDQMASADTIIGDGEYVVVSANTPQNNLVHYSDDFEYCQKVQQHFDLLWTESTEVIFEDLLASSIPSIQHELVTLSAEFWNSILAELVKNPKNIYKLPPRKFEELVAEMLIRDGFSVTLTPETRDGGKDILAVNKTSLGNHLFLVECKRYAPERPVDVSLVRTLYGVVEAEKANAGVLVTTSYFTNEAIKFRDTIRHRMSFKDYENLLEWIRSFQQKAG